LIARRDRKPPRRMPHARPGRAQAAAWASLLSTSLPSIFQLLVCGAPGRLYRPGGRWRRDEARKTPCRSPLSRWFGRRGRCARTFRARGLAVRETTTTAVTGNAQPKWLKLLLNAQPHCGARGACARLDLPPLTVVATSPFGLRHRQPLSDYCVIATPQSVRASTVPMLPAFVTMAHGVQHVGKRSSIERGARSCPEPSSRLSLPLSARSFTASPGGRVAIGGHLRHRQES